MFEAQGKGLHGGAVDVRARATEDEPLNATRHRVARQEVRDELDAVAARGNGLGLGIHGIEGLAVVAGGFDPLDDAAGDPLQAGIQQTGLAVELDRCAGGVVLRGELGLRRAQHQDLPGTAGKEGLIFLHTAAEERKLRIVSGGDDGQSGIGGQTQQGAGGGSQVADHITGIHHGREKRFANTEDVEDLLTPVTRGHIGHLGCARHRAVRGHDPGEAVSQQVRDKEPGVRLFQQLGTIFLQPNELVNGVESELTYAGNLIQSGLGNVLGNGLHHLRRARALPRDDGVKQLALGINQSTVYAEGGDGNAAHLSRIHLLHNLTGAVGKLVENTVGIPDVKLRVLRTGIRGVRLAGLGDQRTVFIHEDSANICRAAV